MIAYFLIKELNLAGYHLPDDMAIGAFDNTYLSNSQILTLTTLSHKSHEMGTAAAEEPSVSVISDAICPEVADSIVEIVIPRSIKSFVSLL